MSRQIDLIYGYCTSITRAWCTVGRRCYILPYTLSSHLSTYPVTPIRLSCLSCLSCLGRSLVDHECLRTSRQSHATQNKTFPELPYSHTPSGVRDFLFLSSLVSRRSPLQKVSSTTSRNTVETTHLPLGPAHSRTTPIVTPEPSTKKLHALFALPYPANEGLTA